MSQIPLIFIVVIYFMCFTSIISKFEVSQIQYKYLFDGKLRQNWILDKHEDSSFLTSSIKCWRNSECFGIALGHLKENKADNKRICYLLKKLNESEDHCSANDCDDEEVQIYQKIELVTTTSTTTDELPATTEVPTTEKPTTSAETTSLSDDTTTNTEKYPECDGVRVIAECSDYPERNAIVAMKSSFVHLLSGETITTDCTEPFMLQDILSSETITRPFQNRTLFEFAKCDENELFAGIEICYSDGEINYSYSYVKCKKVLDEFFLNADEDGVLVDNENDRTEIRCPEGTFIGQFAFFFKDEIVYVFADCFTLEKK